MESKNLGPYELPGFTYSPTYVACLKLIQEGKYSQQIAAELGVSKQNLQFYLKKLMRAGIIQKGIRSSFQEYFVLEHFQDKVKELICDLEQKSTNGGLFLNAANVHNIMVCYPLGGNCEFSLPKEIPNWSGGRSAKIVKMRAGFFSVEKTTKNLLVRFPADYGLTMIGPFEFHTLRRFARHFCCSEADEAVKKCKRYFPDASFDMPVLKASWAFQDKIIKKIACKGLTVEIKRGKKTIIVDKSPHFEPRGEIETNSESTIVAYLSFVRNIEEKYCMCGDIAFADACVKAQPTSKKIQESVAGTNQK